MTPLRMISAQAPAIPDVDEAQCATGRELSRPIYRDRHNLWDRIWNWLRGLFDVGSMIPKVPFWVSTFTVTLVTTIGIALLILLLIGLSPVRRVATPPSLSVSTDDRNADALTRAADTAAVQTDSTTTVVKRFRTITRSFDGCRIIDEYLGMTTLGTVMFTYQTLGEHQVVAPLYEAAHLFGTILYGRVVSTNAQNQQMHEFANQIITTRFPNGYTLVNALAYVPGTPVWAPPRRRRSLHFPRTSLSRLPCPR